MPNGNKKLDQNKFTTHKVSSLASEKYKIVMQKHFFFKF